MSPSVNEQRFMIACVAILCMMVLVGFFLPPVDTYTLPQ